MKEFPIDAVITWVDGDDPVHKAKRMKYISHNQLKNDEVGGEIRYQSIGEIQYCVASILRFAPFVRKIFIVTDGQDPHLEPFIDQYFPERTTQVEIVDHKVVFRDYEDCLPTFTSLSIETVLWRIPDLSEHYIYLNDDFLLVAPVTPEDFFQDGKAICYAHKFCLPFARLLHALRPKQQGIKVSGFKDTMMNAALIAGERRYFLYIGHIPLAMKKTVQEEFYRDHPELFLKNISYKFRDEWQFNPQELYYILSYKSGDCVLRPRKGKDLYIKPKNKPGYMARKLAAFDRSDAPFCCFNSLGYASSPDRELAVNWIRRRLGLI